LNAPLEKGQKFNGYIPEKNVETLTDSKVKKEMQICWPKSLGNTPEWGEPSTLLGFKFHPHFPGE